MQDFCANLYKIKMNVIAVIAKNIFCFSCQSNGTMIKTEVCRFLFHLI